jgi:acetate kinase
MNIFVINSGSSSIKYQLFQMPSKSPLCTGLVERIGLEGSKVTHKTFIEGEEKTNTYSLVIKDHEAGLNKVNELLTDKSTGVIRSTDEIKVVGHRIVHGGEAFTEPTIVTPDVMKKLKLTFQLAPLHNPSGYMGIEVAEKIFKEAKQIVVFDTAFHQTLPAKAFRYAIPNHFYTEHNIRVYGFHGTSHKYISGQATEYFNRPNLKIISIHLGNGCSMAAVKDGKCVDTSMGFGPLSGLIMGTRSGDIDPTVVFYLVNTLGYDINKVSDMLNKQSGMLGLTTFSDMRDISKAINSGDEAAKLAYDMYAYRIKKFIGAYTAILNGLDAIIFTAGVGENDAITRELVCRDMEYMGLYLDKEKNNTKVSGLREISKPGSGVKILIIPTNEELEIATQCYGLLS